MFRLSAVGSVQVLTTSEPVNADTCNTAQEHLSKLLESSQPKLVIDFQQIPLIDSAGLEWLLDLKDQCRELGGELKICGLNSLCQEIFGLTGMKHQFPIYEESLKAVGSFSR